MASSLSSLVNNLANKENYEDYILHEKLWIK